MTWKLEGYLRSKTSSSYVSHESSAREHHAQDKGVRPWGSLERLVLTQYIDKTENCHVQTGTILCVCLLLLLLRLPSRVCPRVFYLRVGGGHTKSKPSRLKGDRIAKDGGELTTTIRRPFRVRLSIQGQKLTESTILARLCLPVTGAASATTAPLR